MALLYVGFYLSITSPSPIYELLYFTINCIYLEFLDFIVPIIVKLTRLVIEIPALSKEEKNQPLMITAIGF
jgi:hypothetical protein